MSNFRVRFAPSPTGFFHIGSARTALFNWLYARHTNGTFVLRIEDTDKERNTPEALQVLLDGMRWLGLDWDEGPEVGGDYGPYFQSERAAIYNRYLEKLKAADKVYEKEGAMWLKISGEPQVIEDAVRGTVTRTEEKDFVIYRSNGTPVFHFVNVVDDIEMRITHVIRGEDHLSNTSKHTELFKAFGSKEPIFAHIPLILKSEGPGKMSKRDKGALIDEYENRQFLPQAVRNYLCLLGWSPNDDREILSIHEIISLFDLNSINKNNAKFDEQKMAFVNSEYVRQLSTENFISLARPVLMEAGVFPEDGNEDYLQSVLSICQEKVKSIEGLSDFVSYFFKEDYPIEVKTKEKVFKKGDPEARLKEILESVESQEDFSEEALKAMVAKLTETYGAKSGEYIMLMRLAVSGQGMGPSFYALLQVLGKERVKDRITAFLNKECN